MSLGMSLMCTMMQVMSIVFAVSVAFVGHDTADRAQDQPQDTHPPPKAYSGTYETIRPTLARHVLHDSDGAFADCEPCEVSTGVVRMLVE